MMPLAVIQTATAQEFGITPTDMLSERRSFRVSRPRMAAMWLSRELTKHSMPAIGRFYNKDHTTVCHACYRVPILCRQFAEYGESVMRLRSTLAEDIPKSGTLADAMQRRLHQMETRIMAEIARDPLAMLRKLEEMLDDA